MRQVLRAGALGRPRGMGWRGRRERGSGWGTHVNPWLIHVNVWQKPLQYCKVISLQLIKINGKKNKSLLPYLGVYRITSPYIKFKNHHLLVKTFLPGHSKHHLPTTQEMTLYMDITRRSMPKSVNSVKDREVLYSQQKQHQELTVAQIMNSLLQNSDLN